MNSATGYAVFSTSNQEGAPVNTQKFLHNYEVRSLGNDGTLSDGSQICAGVADLA